MALMARRAKQASFYEILSDLKWPESKMSRREAMRIKARGMTYREIYEDIDRDWEDGQHPRALAIWLGINPKTHYRFYMLLELSTFTIGWFAFQAIVMSIWHSLK